MLFLLFMGVNKAGKVHFVPERYDLYALDATDCNGVDPQHTW